MRDYRKFCRPETTKHPKIGDVQVKLNCGSTVYVKAKDYLKVKKSFKINSVVGETTNIAGNIKVLDKILNKEMIISIETYNGNLNKFEIIEVIGNITIPLDGDIICYNSILDQNAIFSYLDWVNLDDNWELIGLYGITTYEESEAQDGDFVILANGHTLIISPDDYSKVSSNWEQVDIILTGQVDLGLPSGTIWSTINVGSQTPYERGSYFSWGNLEGHEASYTEGDYSGSIVDYSFILDNYELTDGYLLSGSIPVENDAAADIMGGEWRIPTLTQFQELIDNCTITWITKNGMDGKLFTSNINGKSLFLINNGCGNAETLSSPKFETGYWTSTEDEQYSNKAYALALSTSILPSLTPVHSEEKRFGYGIRAVKIPV